MKKQNDVTKKSKINNAGFSIVELVVVIVIMGVIVGVVAPMFVRYISTNRTAACKANREAVLAIYERCVLEETKKLITDDFETVLNAQDANTKDEVQQYDDCPAGGSYSAEVSSGVAMIKCSHADHSEVVKCEFAGWTGTELNETLDRPISAP